MCCIAWLTGWLNWMVGLGQVGFLTWRLSQGYLEWMVGLSQVCSLMCRLADWKSGVDGWFRAGVFVDV